MLNGGGFPQRRRQWQSWPQPPIDVVGSPFCTRTLETWGRRRGLHGEKLAILVALQHREYLLSLPLPARATDFEDPAAVTNTQLW